MGRDADGSVIYRMALLCAPALLGGLSLTDLPRDGPEDGRSPCTVWIYSSVLLAIQLRLNLAATP